MFEAASACHCITLYLVICEICGLVPKIALHGFDRTAQSLKRQRGGMLLSCGQTTNRSNQFTASQQHCFSNRPSNNQLRQNRSTNERRRTAIRKKGGRSNATLANAQRETEAIAANRIRLFSGRTSVGEFTGVARIGDVIFEGL